MAKLSDIALAGRTATINDVLVGYDSTGPTDHGYTVANIGAEILASPTFTGTATGPDAGTWDSSGITVPAASKINLGASGSFNVNIGQSSAQAIVGVTTSDGTDDTTRSLMIFKRDKGTLGSPATVGNNTHLGTFSAQGYTGATYFGSSQIDFYVDGSIVSGRPTGRVEIATGDKAGNVSVGLVVDSGQNVVCNNAAIATSATDGFLYIPTCAGPPTGAPTAYTGRAPMVLDSTNSKLYVRVGGAWKGVTVA